MTESVDTSLSRLIKTEDHILYNTGFNNSDIAVTDHLRGQHVSGKTIFRDSVGSLLIDSLKHNLGEITETTYELYKKIKYIGKEKVVITRTWTSDPHFICEYPREPLISGKEYTIKICFALKGRYGSMHKIMGFNLSDGTIVNLEFRGIIREESK